MRKQGIAAAAIGLLCASGLAACSEEAKDFKPVSVELEGSKDPVKIGVVFSSTSEANEGRDYAGLAAGVRIAAYRYGQDGSEVELVIADDHGTEQGAADAASVLEGKGVAGVIYASDGSHLTAGLDALTEAGQCVLLPYADASYAESGSVWATGPTIADDADALAGALAAEGVGTPLVIADAPLPSQVRDVVKDAKVLTVAAGDNVKGLAFTDKKPKAGTTGVAPGAPVLIWAAAEKSADLLAQIQGLGHTGTTLLGPSALTSAFAARLEKISGELGTVSSSARYLSFGAPTASTGARSSNFAAAQAIVAQDQSVEALESTDPIGDAVFAGDQRSHDAVVALVTAARSARKADAAGVCGALDKLKVTAADGLAGADLDFADTSAYPAEAVQELQAAQTRQADDKTALVWFAVPVEDGTAG